MWLINENDVETVVQLSKGDIDKNNSVRKGATNAGNPRIVNGYSRENTVSETTDVKIDFPKRNLS